MTTTTRPPGQITLTETEQQLLARVKFKPDRHEQYPEVCRAARELTESLLKRNAVPQMRLAYFTKPEYHTGSKKSRFEVFEANRTEGDDILQHPHFLKYLRYFVFGPDLPQPTIDGFVELALRDSYVSSGDIDDFWSFAKAECRKFALDRKTAPEEFYKLALECGLEEYQARSIRDTVFRMR